MNTEKTPTVAVTGANGMIGSALCNSLEKKSVMVIRLSRNEPKDSAKTWRALPDLSDTSCAIDGIFDEVDTVIHCAGRAHNLSETGSAQDCSLAYHTVNCTNTLRLAKESIRAGVKKFVFISTSGVVAGIAEQDIAFENSDYSTKTPYGESKKQAEIALNKLFAQHPDCTIIHVRPPLVIASHAPGNFASFNKISKLLVINPFTAIQNKRSIITLRNLINLLALITLDKEETPSVVHPVEQHVISTAQLLQACRQAKGKRAIDINIPPILIKTLFFLIGKRALFAKMFGNFIMDSTFTEKKYPFYHKNNVKEELKSLT